VGDEAVLSVLMPHVRAHWFCFDFVGTRGIGRRASAASSVIRSAGSPWNARVRALFLVWEVFQAAVAILLARLRTPMPICLLPVHGLHF
jgi:hypothetical protein